MIRGPISMLIVGAVMLGGIVLFLRGPSVLQGVLPARMVEALDSGVAGGFTSEDARPGDVPTDFLRDAHDGLKVTGPIAAMRGNVPVFIDDVITGYTTSVSGELPVELTTIRPISGCRLTPPLDGTEVGHVTAGETALDLPILTYNDTDLAAAVQVFVNLYRKDGSAQVTAPADLAYSAYDVAVTETKAPVYLILESSVRNRIWNIHVAEGAQVERVILLGGTHAGVANVDPVVPVEVLPDDALEACGISPAYPLNSGHSFFEVLKDGTGTTKQDAEAKLAVMQDRITAYNTWFRDSFGVLADESRAGFGGTISVVGPKPGEADPKAVYASIQGSRIRMTRDAYVEIRGQVPAGEDFAGRVTAIATAFAFGNLANLLQGGQF
jgi:hypothetical protein